MNAEVHIFYWVCIAGLLLLSIATTVKIGTEKYDAVEKIKLNIVNDCLRDNRIDIALRDQNIIYFFDCGKFGHGTMTPIPK